MALNVGELFAEITADNTDLKDALKDSEKAFKEAGSKISDIGKTVTTGVTLPLGAAAFAAVNMASDVSESTNKVNVAFKDNAQQVHDWSQSTLKSFGIAKGTALDMAALYGDMGTAMGQSTEEAQKMSTSLVGLAGDLASFKNIGIEQAQDALKGIFTGEGEALKSLGVIMQDSTLEAFALSQGTGKLYSKMTQAEKVALRYAFVMENTKNAQGDFARTSDGAANQMRIFQETIKETSASFGEILLPYFTQGITEVNKLLDSFKNLDDGMKKNVLFGAGIASAIGPAIIIIGSLVSSIGTISGAIGAIGGGLSGFAAIAVPILGIVAAVAAVVAGIVYLYNTNETVRKSISAAWESVAGSVWEAVARISGIVTSGMAVVQQVVTDILSIVKEVWNTWGMDIYNSVVIALTQVFEWLMTILNEMILPLIQGFINGFKEVWEGGLKDVVEQLLIFVAKATDAYLQFYNYFIAPIIDVLINALVPTFNFIVGLIGDDLKELIIVVSDVTAGLLKALGGIIDFITGVFTGNWSQAWEGVKNIFKGVFDSLYGIARVPLNFIIGGINKMIGGLNSIQIPDWVPGMGGMGLNIGKIPLLEKGGIVDKPTLAMIGEGVEKEVVLPLSKLRNLLNYSGDRQGKVIQFNITGNTISSDYDVERIMNQAIKRLKYEGVY